MHQNKTYFQVGKVIEVFNLVVVALGLATSDEAGKCVIFVCDINNYEYKILNDFTYSSDSEYKGSFPVIIEFFQSWFEQWLENYEKMNLLDLPVEIADN